MSKQKAPTQAELAAAVDLTKYIEPGSLQLATARYKYLAYSPQHELLWRLNQGLQGRDPGPSVNWRGLR